MISPEVLRRYPYFAGIDDESLKQLAMIAEEKSVPAGTVMFREGDPATHLSVILKGEVNIQYVLGNGELRTVDTLVEGDLLMWSALVEPYKSDRHRHHDQGEPIGSASTPLKLRQLCQQDPMLGYRLMTQVAKLLVAPAGRRPGAIGRGMSRLHDVGQLPLYPAGNGRTQGAAAHSIDLRNPGRKPCWGGSQCQVQAA